MAPLFLTAEGLKRRKIAQVRTIDDGFQFYEALLTLDLSDNMIETIQDGAFQSQVISINTVSDPIRNPIQ